MADFGRIQDGTGDYVSYKDVPPADGEVARARGQPRKGARPKSGAAEGPPRDQFSRKPATPPAPVANPCRVEVPAPRECKKPVASGPASPPADKPRGAPAERPGDAKAPTGPAATATPDRSEVRFQQAVRIADGYAGELEKGLKEFEAQGSGFGCETTLASGTAKKGKAEDKPKLDKLNADLAALRAAAKKHGEHPPATAADREAVAKELDQLGSAALASYADYTKDASKHRAEVMQACAEVKERILRTGVDGGAALLCGETPMTAIACAAIADEAMSAGLEVGHLAASLDGVSDLQSQITTKMKEFGLESTGKLAGVVGVTLGEVPGAPGKKAGVFLLFPADDPTNPVLFMSGATVQQLEKVAPDLAKTEAGKGILEAYKKMGRDLAQKGKDVAQKGKDLAAGLTDATVVTYRFSDGAVEIGRGTAKPLVDNLIMFGNARVGAVPNGPKEGLTADVNVGALVPLTGFGTGDGKVTTAVKSALSGKRLQAVRDFFFSGKVRLWAGVAGSYRYSAEVHGPRPDPEKLVEGCEKSIHPPGTR